MFNKKDYRLRRNILIFYPHNPSHPQHGSHIRALQQIVDLREGSNLFIASSDKTSDTIWPKVLTAVREELGIHGLDIYERSRIYRYFDRPIKLVLRVCNRVFRVLGVQILPNNFYEQLSARLMEIWFSHLSVKHSSDLVIIHYTYWANLIEKVKDSVFKAIELHDLLPVNQYLNEKVRDQLILVDGHYQLIKNRTDHSYISKRNELPDAVGYQLQAMCDALANFNLIWTISDREKNLIQEINPNLKVETIYPKIVTKSGNSSVKTSSALLPIGPNIFNTFGLLSFLEDVEPFLRPSDGDKIFITGRFLDGYPISIPASIEFLGLVDNYEKRLKSAKFLIAPAAVGTGQQIKIFEALSYGVPVVCYKCAVPEFMQLEKIGVVCVNDANGFSDAINRLWHDSEYYSLLSSGAAEFNNYFINQHAYSVSVARLFSEDFNL